MFDIFTTHADGSLHLVESLSCVKKAEAMAQRLSCLFPGEYFGCFERAETPASPSAKFDVLRLNAPLTGAFAVRFLA
jgi:hypothetical protein